MRNTAGIRRPGLCEVRVPTYQRPELLHRALRSLQVQDYPHWHAMVMDDSPGREARPVVEGCSDKRIAYCPNAKRLGAAKNLDQAFASHSLVGGEYACVLEDDNWLMPRCLSENIAALERNQVRLLLRNQAICQHAERGTAQTTRTTRGAWFRSGIIAPQELHAYLFLFEGISNGGLFWHTATKCNLQVGPDVHDAGLQEYCRTLQISEPLCFESSPLSYWSEMPIAMSSRQPAANRVFARGVQSIRIQLLRAYGQDIVTRAGNVAARLNMTADLQMSLADALSTPTIRQLCNPRVPVRYLKGLTRFHVIADPLAEYFSCRAHSIAGRSIDEHLPWMTPRAATQPSATSPAP